MDLEHEQTIEVFGAKAHNLKNINVSIPRNKLVVVTGLSGSGKSSLAFDTIYAEGQRRYLETYSSYIRQFLGGMERPEVDKITGLSPVIAIEQKTVSKNPRSTVGTITELYDFLRLLYSRVSTAYSFETGKPMVRYSRKQIVKLIQEEMEGRKIVVLAPLVSGRKGHYRELFEQYRKQGFLRMRVDGEIVDLTPDMRLDRYKVHDIDLVVDRTRANRDNAKRLSESVESALKYGKGNLIVVDYESQESKHFSRFLMCPDSGISYREPEPNLFSFNSPYGACPKCSGLGKISQVELKKIIPNREKSLATGAILPLEKNGHNWIKKQIESLIISHGYTSTTNFSSFEEELIDKILNGTNEYLKIIGNNGINEVSTSFEGLANYLIRHSSNNESKSSKKWANSFMNKIDCPECEGNRLRKESLYFKIGNKNISELARMDLSGLNDWLQNVNDHLDSKNQFIGKEIIKELKSRLNFLLDVGLNYLSLNRSARSLSGGEAQRIRLATQIGSELTGVLYILDEPSIGLHQRDNMRLIDSLKKLKEGGNSVIVVEHDKEIMEKADWIVDIGPGAGINGGEIISSAPFKELTSTESITAKYLKKELEIKLPQSRRKGSGDSLILKGANGNNLQNVTIHIPLQKLVCITGVSGSGKSTLINQTLHPILSKFFYRSVKVPMAYESIEGIEHIDKVIEIDQSPIGRTPRSNPATYTGVFTDIRELFTSLPESKIRGYKPGRFSFNVKGGRCENCKGAGVRTIEMNFLPDVYVSCESCFGLRYNRETLEVRYKGNSISDVLNMTINKAVDFFQQIPHIHQKLATLKSVGLGYVCLGQSSTTLSGGEAQRVKLSSELAKKETGNTLYILDEPTTGLHFEDIKQLLLVLNQLVDNGNTVVIIEHNMDIIKMADHIVDLGPEGGKNGGKIIAEGTPEEIIRNKNSFTAAFLKEELQQNS
ncbi:MAG TPA: excinuclease ABC subunit UvrA [Flavobacteriales bacterium]|nr:excinuclease ABC subunit UvrA [Flavobacteriales bacterium]